MEIPHFGIPPELAGRMSMAEQHEYLRTRLSRRRTLVTAGAVASGLLTGCSGSSAGSGSPSGPRSGQAGATATGGPSPSTSKAPGSLITPFGRHLAFGADPRTQMRISWQVPLAVRKPYVRVGLHPDDLGR